MRPTTPASKNLRERERRLGRQLRGIVISLLAAPLGGAAACHAGANEVTGADASLGTPPFDASTDADAGVPIADSSLPPPTHDATTCEAVSIDDASYEDAPDGCADYRLLPCGLPPEASTSGCFVDLGTCAAVCGDAAEFLYCNLVPLSCTEAGTLTEASTIVNCTACNGITGRRPLGLRAPRTTPRTPVGDYFAAMAHLESASVRAFRDLERWLVAFDAPARLTRAARRAAGDERRHARAASRLARRFGGAPPRARVENVATPSLLALLEDDVVEGCVGETFGALLATWQAAHAEDPRVGRTLAGIAADEARHAALAWEVLAWGAPRLPIAERRRLEGTMEDALVALDRRIGAPLHESARRVAGHPVPADERRLARELGQLVRREARACLVMRRRPAPRAEFT